MSAERVVKAGVDGARIINGAVGPEGVRVLVDASVRAIDHLWIE